MTATATATAATATVQRLLAAAADGLPAHSARLGGLPWRDRPATLVEELEQAGLTGRGGAAFPTWRKVVAVGAGRRPVVIGNAAEGEPASAKDATLLMTAPHLVLDGLQLAADAVGAEEVYLYVKPGPGADSARAALAERTAAGWDRRPVEVHEAPDAFVSGEETAVVSALEGRPALPRFKRRLVVESGFRGRPTLVQNVETLAHVALIGRFGAQWFRAVGVADQPGTFLSTVSGAVRRPGVVEAAYGTSIAEVIRLAGGANEPLRAVLVGGYHGAWLPAAQAAEAPMSRSGLAPWGASPGAGVVIALPRGSCGLDHTARIVSYLAGQSARQCGPCLNGLPHLADTLTRLARHGRDERLLQATHQLSGLLEGRGVCHHPDGTVRLVRSALRTFADDVEAHLAGRCLAGAA